MNPMMTDRVAAFLHNSPSNSIFLCEAIGHFMENMQYGVEERKDYVGYSIIVMKKYDKTNFIVDVIRNDEMYPQDS